MLIGIKWKWPPPRLYEKHMQRKLKILGKINYGKIII
jgi:hypothetical protein